MLPLDALPIVIEMDADPRYESLASKLIEAELSSSSDMESAIAEIPGANPPNSIF